MINIIYNEDCFKTIQRMKDTGQKISGVMTSPPYNTGRPNFSEKALNNHEGRYDIHLDTLSTEDYIDNTISLFNELDNVLDKNGVILYNMSYSTDIKRNKDASSLLWLTIADIIRHTNFTVIDRIIWKKSSALPNNTSHNKLTRIVEDVFVIVRKSEIFDFNANKKVKSVSRTGQKFYENVFNFIEAKNNDGSCKLNKATYSSELCEKLFDIYFKENDIVYDPFMGTGTTAVACINKGINFIGSELSLGQCEFAENRIESIGR